MDQGSCVHEPKDTRSANTSSAWRLFLEQIMVRIDMLNSNIAGSSALVLDKHKDEAVPSLFDFSIDDL